MPPRKGKRVKKKKKMSKHMCIYVASNCTHVVLLPGKFMNFFPSGHMTCRSGGASSITMQLYYEQIGICGWDCALNGGC